jgi:hypothetical protein
LTCKWVAASCFATVLLAPRATTPSPSRHAPLRRTAVAPPALPYTVYPPSASSGPQYAFSLCQPIADAFCTPSTLPRTSAMLMAVGGGCQQSYGSAANSSVRLLATDPSKGLTITYLSGAACSSGVGASYTTLDLSCAAGVPGVAVSSIDLQSGGCHLVISANSSAACPYPKARVVTPLGAGWIAFIVLLALTTLYCVGGVAYKRWRYGSSGVEALPNVDTWRRLHRATVGRLTRGGAGSKALPADEYVNMGGAPEEDIF